MSDSVRWGEDIVGSAPAGSGDVRAATAVLPAAHGKSRSVAVRELGAAQGDEGLEALVLDDDATASTTTATTAATATAAAAATAATGSPRARAAVARPSEVALPSDGAGGGGEMSAAAAAAVTGEAGGSRPLPQEHEQPVWMRLASSKKHDSDVQAVQSVRSSEEGGCSELGEVAAGDGAETPPPRFEPAPSPGAAPDPSGARLSSTSPPRGSAQLARSETGAGEGGSDGLVVLGSYDATATGTAEVSGGASPEGQTWARAPGNGTAENGTAGSTADGTADGTAEPKGTGGLLSALKAGLGFGPKLPAQKKKAAARRSGAGVPPGALLGGLASAVAQRHRDVSAVLAATQQTQPQESPPTATAAAAAADEDSTAACTAPDATAATAVSEPPEQADTAGHLNPAPHPRSWPSSGTVSPRSTLTPLTPVAHPRSVAVSPAVISHTVTGDSSRLTAPTLEAVQEDSDLVVLQDEPGSTAFLHDSLGAVPHIVLPSPGSDATDASRPHSPGLPLPPRGTSGANEHLGTTSTAQAGGSTHAAVSGSSRMSLSGAAAGGGFVGNLVSSLLRRRPSSTSGTMPGTTSSHRTSAGMLNPRRVSNAAVVPFPQSSTGTTGSSSERDGSSSQEGSRLSSAGGAAVAAVRPSPAALLLLQQHGGSLRTASEPDVSAVLGGGTGSMLLPRYASTTAGGRAPSRGGVGVGGSSPRVSGLGARTSRPGRELQPSPHAQLSADRPSVRQSWAPPVEIQPEQGAGAGSQQLHSTTISPRPGVPHAPALRASSPAVAEPAPGSSGSSGPPGSVRDPRVRVAPAVHEQRAKTAGASMQRGPTHMRRMGAGSDGRDSSSDEGGSSTPLWLDNTTYNQLDEAGHDPPGVTTTNKTTGAGAAVAAAPNPSVWLGPIPGSPAAAGASATNGLLAARLSRGSSAAAGGITSLAPRAGSATVAGMVGGGAGGGVGSRAIATAGQPRRLVRFAVAGCIQ